MRRQSLVAVIGLAPATGGPRGAETIRSDRERGDWDRRLDGISTIANRVAVTFSRSDSDGTRHNLAHALALNSDGKIIDIQDHAHPAWARTAARLHWLWPRQLVLGIAASDHIAIPSVPQPAGMRGPE